MKQKKEILSKRTVKDEKDGGELYHIINYKNNEGFVIVSADRRISPILAYSDNNPFTDENLNGVKDWFDSAKIHIKKAKSADKIPENIKQLWNIYEGKNTNKKGRVNNWCDSYYSFNETGRYVDAVARWWQGASARFYAPDDGGCIDCQRKSIGCGAVAMGMVMRYHQHPNMNMCWAGDCLQTNYPAMERFPDGNCIPSNINSQQVSLLLRLAGNAANSHYGVLSNCKTWTLPGKINDAFTNNFSFANGGSWNWLSNSYPQVKSDLQNFFPVIFTGTLNNANLNDAHIWVGDGYAYLTVQYKTYENCDGDGQNCFENCTSYSAEYIGMNWGWGGNDNGYYATTYAFYTSEGAYDSWLRVLTNIRPN